MFKIIQKKIKITTFFIFANIGTDIEKIKTVL